VNFLEFFGIIIKGETISFHIAEGSWHPAGNLRVWGSNPGCQKNPTKIFPALTCAFND